MSISRSFICKCGKAEGWIHDGKLTKPCPECGRKYKGVEKRAISGLTEIKVLEVEK